MSGNINSLSKELQSCKSKNEYLENKMKALEEDPKETRRWFHGDKAHELYLKEAKNPKSQHVNLEKKAPFCPGKGKYGYVRYNLYCTHCGKNGHKVQECESKRALKSKPYVSYKSKPNQALDLNDPSYYQPIAPSTKARPRKSILGGASTNPPTKPKL